MTTDTAHPEDPDTQATDRPPATSEERTLLQSVALGLKSGLLATVVMTLFRMPISHSPPPTARFWSQYVAGGEPEDHLLVGVVLHFVYGMGGGLVFTELSPVAPAREVEEEKRGVLAGLGFGLLLSVFGVRALLGGLLDVDLDPDERFVFHLSHAIYGLTLGAWYGSAVEEA